jgi:hypothetical protein
MILKFCVTCLQTRKMHITLKNHKLGKGITSVSIHAKSLLRIFHIGTHPSQKYAPTTLAINNFFRVNAFLPVTLCPKQTSNTLLMFCVLGMYYITCCTISTYASFSHSHVACNFQSAQNHCIIDSQDV